ncbi:MAG TPA: aminoacetone oxidase family FAD-binding enzyme [Clostridia bacterium]
MRELKEAEMDRAGQAYFDIAVIGGGAAGLAAVLAARSAETAATALRIVLLEKGARVGRKLLATGNGTCNLTNLKAGIRYYHGTDPEFVRSALARYTPEAILLFFDSLGVPCRALEDGRVYPYGAQASAVLDALRLEAGRRGIETLCGFDVRSVRKREPLLFEDTPLYEARPFEILSADGRTIRSRAVVVATGGPAAPQLGGDDSGYALMKAFGHDITRPLPAIVQITTVKEPVKSLSGIRVDGVATLRQHGREIRSEAGEILFTDYGLSGPPILQLGGYVSRAMAAVDFRSADADLEIALDFFPDMERSAMPAWLSRRAERLDGVSGADFLSGMLNKRIGQLVVRTTLERRLGDPVGKLSPGEAEALAAGIKDTRIHVTGVQGWREAQVSAGGVLTSGFDPDTMASRRAAGLFACGEVLDIDGDCGGYNLHWAWCSGLMAGTAAAKAAGGA